MRYPFMLAAVLALSAAPALAQTVVPVQFARGMSSSSISGSIRGDSYTDYRVSVRAGQKMTVSMTPTAGSPYFNVMEPGSNNVAIYNSSMGDQRWTGITAKSGAYTIRVYQMRATARRGETAKFRLMVAVAAGATVGSGAPAHRHGDALVPGTPYHATATIRCRSAMGAPMGLCKAGVIRRTGSATIHLDTPDGGERTILFRDGAAVSSDARAPFAVTRRGDISVVRIGTVEIYEIPDALVEGG